MTALFNTFEFEPGSRMTGIWDANRPLEDDDEPYTYVSMVRLGADQDGSLESSFLGAHLPFHAGGFHGVGPDGTPWAVMIQVAPGSTMALNGASHPYWTMLDAIRRALIFNPEAELAETYAWPRESLETIYGEQGVAADLIADWDVRDLLLGLLAECCYVPLEQIVAGRITQCAFPDDAHDCQHDVFADVFAMWTSGALNPPEPEPEDELDARTRREVIAQMMAGMDQSAAVLGTSEDLEDMSKQELLELASTTLWDLDTLEGLSRKKLLRLLTTPHPMNNRLPDW